ncbi:hypothetical protein COLO4_28895 [Corchorus olitorius]|uniref:Uncharacterized protein n=1 Tax=Corchorus olitorius TaxID=93759 RepID=A0A1R3HHU2_9ROSI|nr:hypothetical protein COLO4_28895 [Corchorus olitorius]
MWPLELGCVKDHRNYTRFAPSPSVILSVLAYFNFPFSRVSFSLQVLMLSWPNGIFLGAYTISSRVK